MRRVEKPLIPPDAMREILVNALIHRDYTIAGGRGTNRVVSMCRDAGIAPPKFEEISGAAVVTFRVPVSEVPVISTEPGREKLIRLKKEGVLRRIGPDKGGK